MLVRAEFYEFVSRATQLTRTLSQQRHNFRDPVYYYAVDELSLEKSETATVLLDQTARRADSLYGGLDIVLVYPWRH